MKICVSCFLEQEESYFHKKKSSKDGLQSSCKSCVRSYRKQYHLLNKEKENIKNHFWACAHREETRIKDSQRRKDNKNKRNKHDKERKKTDINYKIACNLRRRLLVAIKSEQKKGSAIRDLGCSVGELKRKLESLFYSNPETGEKMTWENYGVYGWHIDHIIPLASFDLTDREQFLKACHYTNLQPLWAKDNYVKRDIVLDI